MISYNKLVRDRIPEIIRASGRQCDVRVLGDDEYLAKLEEKLQEELDEYRTSRDVAELADLLEVVDALLKHCGVTQEEFERIQAEKRTKRGSFSDRLLLISAEP